MHLDSTNGRWPTGNNGQVSSASGSTGICWSKARSRASIFKRTPIRAKGRKLIVWIALAIDVTTRLWLAGVVSQHRDHTLIDRLFQQVRACCQFVQGLLVCTDGFAAYSKSIGRVFREKVKKHAGRGRCALEACPDGCIATVIKHIKNKKGVEITRKITRGTQEKAQELLVLTQAETQFNTAFIERLNGTFRERLASLTRRCRHAAARMETLEAGMDLIGCTYNFWSGPGVSFGMFNVVQWPPSIKALIELYEEGLVALFDQDVQRYLKEDFTNSKEKGIPNEDQGILTEFAKYIQSHIKRIF